MKWLFSLTIFSVLFFITAHTANACPETEALLNPPLVAENWRHYDREFFDPRTPRAPGSLEATEKYRGWAVLVRVISEQFLKPNLDLRTYTNRRISVAQVALHFRTLLTDQSAASLSTQLRFLLHAAKHGREKPATEQDNLLLTLIRRLARESTREDPLYWSNLRKQFESIYRDTFNDQIQIHANFFSSMALEVAATFSEVETALLVPNLISSGNAHSDVFLPLLKPYSHLEVYPNDHAAFEKLVRTYLENHTGEIPRQDSRQDFIRKITNSSLDLIFRTPENHIAIGEVKEFRNGLIRTRQMFATQEQAHKRQVLLRILQIPDGEVHYFIRNGFSNDNNNELISRGIHTHGPIVHGR